MIAKPETQEGRNSDANAEWLKRKLLHGWLKRNLEMRMGC